MVFSGLEGTDDAVPDVLAQADHERLANVAGSGNPALAARWVVNCEASNTGRPHRSGAPSPGRRVERDRHLPCEPWPAQWMRRRRIGSGLDSRFAEGPVLDPPLNTGQQVTQCRCAAAERGPNAGPFVSSLSRDHI
jgi:hypothetical protein